TDGVPHFDSRRRVSEREPIPHVKIVRAVMNAGDLAKLQRVQHQTGISVRSEPIGAVLIFELGAQRMRRMSAKIQDGRQRSGRAVWDIKISGDVEPRQALKNNLFD